jgi:hypothetical protein
MLSCTGLRRKADAPPAMFRLIGFDQRVRPPFVHSTTAHLTQIRAFTDDSWVVAVDEVVGADFSPGDGTYYINVNLAFLAPAPLPEWCLPNRFFDTKEKALAWARAHPHFMTVRILTPGA